MGHVLNIRFRPGPATIASASFLCLLIGLLFLALQIKTIFSDQLKQEYSGLVLEGVERAESARNLVRVWQQQADNSNTQSQQSEAYRRARVDLAARIASLAALVNASPSAAPRIPQSALSPDANLDDTDALLAVESVYWREQRDRDSVDARTRITRAAHTLIVLSALVFGALITALGMYAKRTRQLAGESHKFEHAALHDAMTGLPNRRKLFATLAETAAVSEGNPKRRKIAVLYVDLDGFKQVNDSLGHHIGDKFLIAVSRRFRQTVRVVDVVARFGGDEFVVLVREFSTTAELEAIAQRLIACVVQTDEQMGIGFVRASIGIASFPDPVEDYHHLVSVADETMYQVKRNGKNGYAFATRSK
ncbi:GGDEF domain-containing protein [Caballeronia sp. SEWSISQ10-4 2]|uniref:GGDEF domain-containing protein n=1 Tax=Caballeronia sp. SEWSISQ10-4 2 TaxID=2937438 RepID=UPI002655E022|nr:GGDEF domain-containing protein [Caballeronia sp. SEWSISQ10-4 2]MDN7181480.1 GGDEF domain-containing protein [Caballeronia sp. SEWSISQ10-4 2]